MSKTSAFRVVRRALRKALHGERSSERSSALLSQRITRRSFGQSVALAASARAAVQLGIAGCHADLRPSHHDARIAVVGAGMAGLLCAYRLREAGLDPTVYEASARAGGRMWTARGKLQDAQLVELGGEFIDSEHSTLLGLADELGIALDDLTPEPGIRADSYFIAGRLLSETEIVDAFRPLAARMQEALRAAEQDPDVFAKLDAQSIGAWLDAQPDLDANLSKLLRIAYVGEYGLPADEQSVLNLLWLIDSERPDPFRVFGDSDERFHAHLGNDQFPTELAKRLGERVQFGHRLTRVREFGRKYRLSFDREGGALEREFDSVVLAIPFSVLRQVDLALELPPLKRQIIRELGYGTNAKVFGQFQSRVWLEQHRASGGSISDLAPQATWDTSRGQAGASGVLTVFLGGREGLEAGAGTAEERMRGFLGDLDTIFPGTRAAYREGSALRMHWPSMPFALGSYTCYRPGQAVWSGQEGERVGHVHFCGEHTSVDYQGYMEGAAESGERVAREILSDFRVVAARR